MINNDIDNQNETGKNESIGLNGYSNESYSTQRHDTKIPLKLVMDPRGVVQDVYSTGITFDPNSGMLSPDKCAELVSALHTDAPKGKGFYRFNFAHEAVVAHFVKLSTLTILKRC